MRRYLAISVGTFQVFATWRLSLLFTLAGNVLYIVLVRFLWGSIYEGSEMIHGLTFDQAFVYLSLASSIFILFTTWTEWIVVDKIQNGNIIVDLITPLDFQLHLMFLSGGLAFSNLVSITIPSVLVLVLVFGAQLPIGVGLLFFPLSLLLAFLINFNIDYIVGMTAFYTESLWGISMTKEIIVSALSGMLIPLQFFPETALKILRLLPFQAVYHIPLTYATSADLELGDCVQMLGVQVAWVAALFVASRLYQRRAIKVLTVAGG